MPKTAQKPARSKPYTKPSQSIPTDRVVIDAAGLPIILDVIVQHAPLSSLLALRSASKGCKARIDSIFKNSGLHLSVTPGSPDKGAVLTVRRFGCNADQGIPATTFLLNLVRIFDFDPGVSTFTRFSIMDKLSLTAKRNRRAVRLPNFAGGALDYASAPTLVVSFDAFPLLNFVPRPPLTLGTIEGNMAKRVTKLVCNIYCSDEINNPSIHSRIMNHLFPPAKNIKDMVFVFHTSTTPVTAMSPFAGNYDTVGGLEYLMEPLLSCCAVDRLNFVVRKITFVDIGRVSAGLPGETLQDRHKRIGAGIRTLVNRITAMPMAMLVRNGVQVDSTPVTRLVTSDEYRAEIGDEQFMIETQL